MEPLTFSALAGIIGTCATALIVQPRWTATTKRIMSMVVVAALVAGGVVFHYVPQVSAEVLSAAGVTYGVSQVVFAALKPFKWFNDIVRLTSPADNSENHEAN